MIDQMVKGTSEVLDGIPNGKRNVGWDGSNVNDLVDALSGVRIVLGREFVCVFNKIRPEVLKIEDVFFGPF